MRLGPDDLLDYNAQYKVLICRECQYGIQKSAVESHLLKHKIYRAERHALLNTISQLNLLEPDHITAPSRDSLPVEGLPVISGHACMIAGCERLYGSSKRIRQHQSDSHGSRSEVSALVREALLQTFFRGTKLKYFEVSGRSASETEGYVQDVHDDSPMGLVDEAQHLREDTRSTHQGEELSFQLDMRCLNYFHHFLFDTSHTLPTLTESNTPPQYWHESTVSIALQDEVLMTGVLSISAYHEAFKAQDKIIRAEHFLSAARFQKRFDLESLRTTGRLLASDTVPRNHLRLLSSILALCRSAAAAAASDTESNTSTSDSVLWSKTIVSNLRHLIYTKNFFTSNDKNYTAFSNDDVFKQAAVISITSQPSPKLAAIFRHLQELPANIANALGRPTDVEQATIVLKAIASLVTCTAMCHVASKKQDIFNAGMRWLVMLPETFLSMVSERNAAALVVLAHWAALCLSTVQVAGFWILTGLEVGIRRMVEMDLSTEDIGVRDLVKSLWL